MSDLVSDRARPPVAATTLGSVSRALAGADFGALVSLAAALALGVGLILWSTRPSWVPVTGQAARGDPLELVELLTAAGIENRLDPASGLLLVPQQRLGEVRLTIAAKGLDADPSVGLELLSEEPSLGASHFNEVRRYQHAIEIELARTISGMRHVESARVHLALPQRSVFVRDREAASASVMIRSETGRALPDEQVDAVSRLVASAIPFLDPADVTIVDRWGQLLSSTGEEPAVNREQYRYTRQLEQLYAERIEALLAPVIGRGSVHASVAADVDFSLNERTEEAFVADPLKMRSEQSEARSDTGSGAVGIPGALVNQPPQAGTVDAEPGTADAAAPAGSTSQSTVRNYELDKTITHVRNASGTVRRLSVAVVVDDRVTIDAAGEMVRTPLTPEDIEIYTALAREAVGFDAARGDTVVVSNRGFLPMEAVEPLPETPFWQHPWVSHLVRQSLVGLAVLILVLTGVRPALKRLLRQRRGHEERVLELSAGADASNASAGSEAFAESAAKSGAPVRPSPLEAPPVIYGDILNMARAIAAEDPKRVARLVKDWVGND